MSDLAALATTLAAAPATASATASAAADRTRLQQAAKQFEAIFVRQMLSQARAAKLGGDDPLFGGQAMDTFNSMQDERMAQIAVDSGAFGLAKSIEIQLAAQVHLPREVATPLAKAR